MTRFLRNRDITGITRDPLKAPCLTEVIWHTLLKVPASDLAKTLRFVRSHQARRQSISGPPPSDQAVIEESNVMSS